MTCNRVEDLILESLNRDLTFLENLQINNHSKKCLKCKELINETTEIRNATDNLEILNSLFNDKSFNNSILNNIKEITTISLIIISVCLSFNFLGCIRA